jgi:hypothetical protein
MAPRSLLLKLIRAMLAASIVVPVSVFGLFAWHSYNQVVQSAQDRAKRLAAVVQEHSLKVFETIGLVLQTADQRLRGVDRNTLVNSRALWDELRTLEQSSEQVASIFVVDRDGFGLFTTRVFPSPVYDFSDRDYYYSKDVLTRACLSVSHMSVRSVKTTSSTSAFAGPLKTAASTASSAYLPS